MSSERVRISGPEAIVGAVPQLCGFVPAESLVALSLHGPRRRLGLTLRLDLPAARQDEVVGGDVGARLEHDGADAVVLVVYTERGGPWPRRPLVDALRAEMKKRRIAVVDALLVRGGRWWSYTCAEPSCCPPEGTEVVGPPAALAAAAAYDGRAVLRDRAALVASLAPPTLLAARAAGQRLDAAMVAELRAVERSGVAVVRRGAVAAVRAARAEALRTPPADPAALVAGLQDLQVRDEVATLALDETDALLSLLLALARVSVAPYDAPVCALIALVAWVRGDGALANVALDRALEGDPAYGMALLLRTGLDGQLPPAAVREWLRDTRRAMQVSSRGQVA
jgi:hypothetical protein